MKLCTIVPAAAVLLASSALGQGLLLNEYNGVGSTKFLQQNQLDKDEGRDTFFGRVLGNGGNWIELVVTQDHMDIRGWQIRWAENLNFSTTGQDIWYGNGGVEQGIITFSNNALWSDLRAGTIITICEHGQNPSVPVGNRGKDIDLTFDPCRGDWWINVVSFGHPEFVTTVTNKTGDGPGNFSTGNNGWLAEIRDASGNLRMEQRGEGAPGYGGSGVNSEEVGKLKGQLDGSDSNIDWDDADLSQFGIVNSWGSLIYPECRDVQDASLLRAPVLAECETCTPLFLNEYNAVSSDAFLNGGTLTSDDDFGQAADAFFGRVLGNGGNWFELVVGADNLDIRGWTLAWTERDTGGYTGTITLSQNPALASLPKGTIVTVIENLTADGGLDTNLSLGGSDRWINLCTRDASVVASTSTTKPDTLPGDFTTSNDRWTLEIRDASGAVVAGPFGEGAEQYWRGGVSSTDVCRLEEDPGAIVTMASNFDDTGRFSTFGAPNQWAACPDFGDIFTQDFSGLAGCDFGAAPCTGDLDTSGAVDSGDIGTLLLLFGQNGGPGDLDASGTVDAGDIGVLLILFGPCN